MDKPDFNVIVVRAAKTFVQGFIAAWTVTGFDFGKGALVGALAAGVSALMNLIIAPQEAK